jgi:hypothetical protein
MNRTTRCLVFLLLAICRTSPSEAGVFSDVVVVSIGDGNSANPDPLSVPVSLLSFSTAGAPGYSLTMPTTTSGSNHALTLSNNRAAGGLNLTSDGRFLVLGGTDNPPRPTPNTNATRTIGRVDDAGNVDTSTTLTDYGGTGNIGIRTVASVDGNSYYTSGNGSGNSGVLYVAHGASSSTVVTTAGPTRHLTIAGGNLFLAQDSSMNQIGSGLPNSGPQSVTALAGVGAPPAGGNWNSPLFFDLNPSVAGVDTLYLGVQRSNSVELPAVVKYTFDGGNWSQASTFDLGTNIGMLFLTGRLEGDNVVLYGVTDTSGAPSFGNSLVKLTDLGVGSAFTQLASSGPGYGFRGVAFAPVPEPATAILVGAAVNAAARCRYRQRRVGKA